MLNPLRYTLVFRGVLALVVGLVAVGWPEVTIGVFVLLFAVYAIVAAGADVVAAFRADHAGSVVGHVLLAIASVAAGVLTLAWPDVTVQVFALIVACWALAAGAMQVHLPSGRRASRASARCGRSGASLRSRSRSRSCSVQPSPSRAWLPCSASSASSTGSRC